MDWNDAVRGLMVSDESSIGAGVLGAIDARGWKSNESIFRSGRCC